MSKNKDQGFGGLIVGIAFFILAIFIENYPWYVHSFGQSALLDKFYIKVTQSGLLGSALKWRLMAVAMIFGATMLYRPIKNQKIDKKKVWLGFGTGLGFFLVSAMMMPDGVRSYQARFIITAISYAILSYYTVKMFQAFSFVNRAESDPFNDEQESYKQMEERIDTPYSANIPYTYKYKGKKRNGWVNFVNLFRALLVVGTPGSGKTFAIISELMHQLLGKGFAMVVYSYKRDDLVSKVHGHLEDVKQQHKNHQENPQEITYPKLFRINFDDPRFSNRCNPISAYGLKNQTDALDSAATLMKNINREWIKKSDYFAKSAISFTGGLLWYLKKISEYKNIDYCTFGHLCILTTVRLDYLMPVIMDDPEVRHILVPFRDAMERKAMDQLSGQTSSVQISLANMATKEIFYITGKSEFDLIVNDPLNPKVVALQNNPDREQVYSAPLGLYLNTILKRINAPKRRPMAVVIDELPTLFTMMLRTIIDTGRENKIATILGIQSVGQLILDYGKELADVIYDNCANIICGAAKGETARRLSELFGKIHQEKVSKNTNSNDVSTNLSTQMMELLPKSKVAAMSTGTFAALVADTFEHKIKEKKSYGELKPNIKAKKRAESYKLPKIREFKYAGFEQEIKALEGLLINDKTFLLCKKLFDGNVDYIDFYDDHLFKIAMDIYKQKGDDIAGALKRLKVFNWGQELKEFTLKGDQDGFYKYFKWMISEAFEREHMQRVLHENFANVINDIDELVKEQYEKVTGKGITSAIFDEKKINGDIAQTLHDNEDFSFEEPQQEQPQEGPEEPPKENKTSEKLSRKEKILAAAQAPQSTEKFMGDFNKALEVKHQEHLSQEDSE